MTKALRMQPHRWFLLTAVAMATLCSASVAWAGEIKFGTTKLAVDDKGNLTAEGRKAAVDTVDEVPAEDRWEIHIWAKLDNAAEGPLYFQFSQNLNGTASDVWRFDEANYPGGKYFSADMELVGGAGFNKDRTYDVKAVQVSAKGKDLTLATGKIKLIKSGKKPAKDPNEDKDEADPDQDAIDSLGGDEPEGTDKSAKETPPPVEPKAKKGCSIDSDGSAWNGALLLLVLGVGLATHRRRDQ